MAVSKDGLQYRFVIPGTSRGIYVQFLSRTEAAEAALTLFWAGLFVFFLQFLFSLLVEFLISAIRLSRPLPKFIGATHNIHFSGSLHFRIT